MSVYEAILQHDRPLFKNFPTHEAFAEAATIWDAARDQLGDDITLLAGQLNAANYRFLKLLAEFDRVRGWSCDGTVKTFAHWLCWKCGISPGVGREKVRVANALKNLPLTDAAFATGAISYSKVRAITRAATPANESILLNVARHGTAYHVETVVRQYCGICRIMEKDTEATQQESRYLRWSRDDDGMWVFKARLPPEAGAIVANALSALAQPALEARQIEQEEQRHAEKLKADSIDTKNVPAETFASAVEAETRQPGEGNIVQIQADSLVVIAEHFLATMKENPEMESLIGADRCQIVLHLDINTLREGLKGAEDPDSLFHEHCHLENNTRKGEKGRPGKAWLSAATAKRLSCDASLLTVLEDEQGQVLNIGRRSRTVPTAIARGLALRDHGCRFPGCCESHYTEAHHIQHWAHGGETSMENLVTLCHRHHQLLHMGCYTIRTTPNLANPNVPHLIFESKSGAVLEQNLYPQFPPELTASAISALQQAAPDVTTKTAVTLWCGERCDYSIVQEGLFDAYGRKATGPSWLS
mgnify:CR=1 FL=1